MRSVNFYAGLTAVVPTARWGAGTTSRIQRWSRPVHSSEKVMPSRGKRLWFLKQVAVLQRIHLA